MKKWFLWLATISGAGIAFLGIIFVAMYIMEGIIKRIGEPDQSLLFWYLPILFIGIICIIIGISLFVWGLKFLRSIFFINGPTETQQSSLEEVPKSGPEKHKMSDLES
jgi:hypothetical protein